MCLPFGRAESAHLNSYTGDEIAATYAAGHSVLIYQHFPREARDGFIARLVADLAKISDGAHIVVFKTAHVAILLFIHPKHEMKLASVHVTEGWDASFMAQTQFWCDRTIGK